MRSAALALPLSAWAATRAGGADIAAPASLGPLPIDPAAVTVSGISSGGSMAVQSALVRYYRGRTQDANLVRIEREGAGHNFPVATGGASPYASSEPPYIANCGYDAARALLQHLYGPLRPAATSSLSTLQAYDQRPYAQPAGSVALDDRGWL